MFVNTQGKRFQVFLFAGIHQVLNQAGLDILVGPNDDIDIGRRDIEPRNSWVVALKPDVELAETALEPPPEIEGQYEPWPYRDTAVYELAPEKTMLPPGHADFYEHYYPMGSFPEVVRTRRQILVIFLGSFFFFLEPIL